MMTTPDLFCAVPDPKRQAAAPAEAPASPPVARTEPPARPLPAWWPRCEACQRTVERIAISAFPDRTELRIRVDCHGEHKAIEAPVHRAGNVIWQAVP